MEGTVSQAPFGLVTSAVGVIQRLVGGPPVGPGGDGAGERLGLEQQAASYTCLACSPSTTRTAAPLYGFMVTRPAPARVLSASRTGVLDTPSTSARSVSTRGCPGLSSPARIACLIASSTATVRDGSAPAAPVRNAGALTGEASGAEAYGVDTVYRISYMTGFERKPGPGDMSMRRDV